MHFDADIRVRYSETDQMGIVYHSNYFPWFEEARTGLFEAVMGMTYRELEEQGILFPLVECNCRFRRPAHYADRLAVRSRVREVKGARVTIEYEAYRQPDGELLAEGFTTHVFVGRDFKPLNIMRVKPEVYKKLQESVEP
jgi:acyl-CoA thioester hydrolase